MTTIKNPYIIITLFSGLVVIAVARQSTVQGYNWFNPTIYFMFLKPELYYEFSQCDEHFFAFKNIY